MAEPKPWNAYVYLRADQLEDLPEMGEEREMTLRVVCKGLEKDNRTGGAYLAKLELKGEE